MSEKVTNDMVAHVKSIAQKRGRNVKWAEKAVRESVSVTESEALKENIIDLIAKDIDDLIKQINGRKVEDKDTKRKLKDKDFKDYKRSKHCIYSYDDRTCRSLF